MILLCRCVYPDFEAAARQGNETGLGWGCSVYDYVCMYVCISCFFYFGFGYALLCFDLLSYFCLFQGWTACGLLHITVVLLMGISSLVAWFSH